jgi:hypothetical protein
MRLEIRNCSASLTCAARSDHSASETPMHTPDLLCLGPSGAVLGRRGSPFLNTVLGARGEDARNVSTSNSVPYARRVHIFVLCLTAILRLVVIDRDASPKVAKMGCSRSKCTCFLCLFHGFALPVTLRAESPVYSDVFRQITEFLGRTFSPQSIGGMRFLGRCPRLVYRRAVGPEESAPRMASM